MKNSDMGAGSEVDLRWGIAKEQSTRKETLKPCLDETI
jgi:hypothetical protein